MLRGFLTVPASHAHHHATVGGLCDHSLEMAEAALNHPHLLIHSNEEAESLAVAALFHDLGKVRTFCRDGGRHQYDGFYLDHKQVMWELLAEALRELEQHHYRLALVLRTLWTELNQPTALKRFPLALALQQLDSASALRSAAHCAFTQAPHWQRRVRLGEGGAGQEFLRLV